MTSVGAPAPVTRFCIEFKTQRSHTVLCGDAPSVKNDFTWAECSMSRIRGERASSISLPFALDLQPSHPILETNPASRGNNIAPIAVSHRVENTISGAGAGGPGAPLKSGSEPNWSQVPQGFEEILHLLLNINRYSDEGVVCEENHGASN